MQPRSLSAPNRLFPQCTALFTTSFHPPPHWQNFISLRARKDLFGCPGDSPWLARRIKLKTYASFLSPLTMPPLWPPKREYNAVSAVTDEIWQYRTVETSRYLIKITILWRKADRKSARSKVLVAKHTCSQAYGFATITMYS